MSWNFQANAENVHECHSGMYKFLDGLTGSKSAEHCGCGIP